MLSPQLLKILRAYWRLTRPTRWLFPGRDSERPLDATVLHAACRSAHIAAGLNKRVCTHYGTVLRPIFWRTAPTFVSSRFCLAMPACRARRATPRLPPKPSARPRVRLTGCDWRSTSTASCRAAASRPMARAGSPADRTSSWPSNHCPDYFAHFSQTSVRSLQLRCLSSAISELWPSRMPCGPPRRHATHQLGCVRQAALRRTRPGPGLSRPLHPSRRVGPVLLKKTAVATQGYQ